MSVSKLYISPQELLEKSFELAFNILKSGFVDPDDAHPIWILAVWRGGTPIGIAVQEYLKYHNIKTDHIAIRTSSYIGINQQISNIQVHGLGSYPESK